MISGQTLRALLSAVVCTAVMTAPVWALDQGQTTMLRDATTQLTQAETNLKLAQESAGPAGQAIPAARGRLAASRLSSAKSSLAQAEGRLQRLPADDAEVKAFKTKYDLVAGEIAALEARLTAPAGGVATPAVPAQPANPQPGAPAAPAAPAAARLNYQQEQLLKDARFYVNEVTGIADAVEKIAADAQKAADKQSLDHRLVNTAMSSLEKANQRITNINSRISQLPANGAGVAEMVAEHKKQSDRISAYSATLAPIQEMFVKALDPKTYPEFDGDLKRVQELARQFYDTQVFQTDLARAGQIAAQLKPAGDEATRITRKYTLLVNQKTPEGVAIDSAAKNFASLSSAFATAVKEAAQALPGAIDANIAKIDGMVKEAVEQKKPAWFPGGIADEIVHVKAKLALVEVIAADQARASADKIAKVVDRVKAAQNSLSESIIQANELPPDRYRGGDRDALIQQATAIWKKEDPSATVLAARIPSESWKRTELWRYSSSTWTKYDSSALQVQLIVKRDDKVAEIRPINLTKDHTQGDRISGGSLFPKNEALGPSSLMLTAKVK